MDALDFWSLRIANYKCFRDLQGFEKIAKFNIIIGKNNSGKSALLDLLEYAVHPTHEIDERTWHRATAPEIFIMCETSEKMLAHAVKPQTESPLLGPIQQYGKLHFKDWKLTCKLVPEDAKPGVVSFERPDGLRHTHDPRYVNDFTMFFINEIMNPFSKYVVARLAADRDVVPELNREYDPGNSSRNVRPNGDGATNLVQHFINMTDLPGERVEQLLLEDLNAIFRPDAVFSRILVQQVHSGNNKGRWEINLEEEGKGRVPLTNTGSGIKTVLLVLINIHLVPYIMGYETSKQQAKNRRELRDFRPIPVQSRPLSQFLFAFEELENNLHPSVQRRLFQFLADKAEKEGCRFFVTTHSHVVIDMFAKRDIAQIVHVENTDHGKGAICSTIESYNKQKLILDDLGVRASDLLQSNVIVWVEGPSDRLYFNKWIEQWTKDDDVQLKEHVHYQCIHSGGSVISHLSFDDPMDEAELIQALKFNRNAIVIIDSDKTSEDSPLQQRAKRVAEEVENTGGIAWITRGRYIEHYIPAEVLQIMYTKKYRPKGDDEHDIFDYIESIGGIKSFRDDKPKLAKLVCKHITKAFLQRDIDLTKRLNRVCDMIRRCNGL